VSIFGSERSEGEVGGFSDTLAVFREATGITAVYTGSFDPPTLGHLHIIERAGRLFDRLIIGIGVNSEKRPLFPIDQRVELLRELVKPWPQVEVLAFEGLAVDFVRRQDSAVMVRGIRPLTDTAGEFTMMMANRKLAPDIETVFLMAGEEFAHISSSLLKQIAQLSHTEALASFVPQSVLAPLRERLKQASS
jgi:pantetheine-phosphate adenylyltransferase